MLALSMQSAPEPASPEPPASELAPARALYPWFMTAIGAWFGSWGMQQVLFSWLVVGELRADPRWVGTAQMFQNLPSLALLLAGGVTADRLDRRSLLVAVHLVAAATTLIMAKVVDAGALSLGALLVYGLAWGSFQSFVGPARDALLSDVAEGALLRAVTTATLVQFVAQALGARGAGLAERYGSPALLAAQAGVLLVGLVPLSRLALSNVGRQPREIRRRALPEIREGLRAVWSSPRLRPVAFLVASNGLFFLGPYYVLCPLIVRDVHHGGVTDLSLVLVVFPAGTVLGSLLLLVRGGIRRKGRALLLGLLGGGLCLAGMGLPLPFPAFLAVVFVWGLCGAVFLNMSRTLFQESAPAQLRGRVLSVYSVALLGVAPASNLGAGLLADALGPAAGCMVFGFAMVLLIAFAWGRTEVRSMSS
jgi:MFS family permease